MRIVDRLMKKYFFALTFVLFLAVIISYRYNSYMAQVWYGDDLALIIYLIDGHINSFTGILTGEIVSADKFRPIYIVFQYILYLILGTDINGYMKVNFVLHLFNAVLFFQIAYKVSGSKLYSSLLVSLSLPHLNKLLIISEIMFITLWVCNSFAINICTPRI